MELRKICTAINQTHEETTFEAIRNLFVAMSFYNTARLLSQDPSAFDDDGSSFEVAVEIYPNEPDSICLMLNVCSNLDYFKVDEEVAEELVDDATFLFDGCVENLNDELKNKFDDVFFGVILKVNGSVVY